MKRISDILKSHPVPGVREAEIRVVCARVASTLTGIAIPSKKVRYENGTAFFTVPPVVKSELMMKEVEFKRVLSAAGIEIADVR